MKRASSSLELFESVGCLAKVGLPKFKRENLEPFMHYLFMLIKVFYIDLLLKLQMIHLTLIDYDTL